MNTGRQCYSATLQKAYVQKFKIIYLHQVSGGETRFKQQHYTVLYTTEGVASLK